MRLPPHIINSLMLIILALMWGASFSFIKIAVSDITPLTVAAARISLGALVLTACVFMAGGRLPKRLYIWGVCFAVGVSGAALPFGLIAWGETRISSSSAAICMALMPITTLLLAHFITRDEKISRLKAIGIATGFAGVFLMFGQNGPGMAQQHGSSAAGLAAVLLATFSYAVSSLLSVRLRDQPRLNSAAAVLISAAIVILPLALVVEHPWTLAPGPAALGAVLFLGLFPTALAMLMLIALVARAGATFMTLSNYLVPVVGVALGAAWLGEQLTWHTALAFLLICLGIYVTGLKTGAKSKIA